jgi:8-amino-3,8-dideoxy-alpha-D-manno-octulosonate transaminase
MARSKEKDVQRLALQGGMRAVGAIEGKGEPKIGVEEFMAVAARFGFSAGTLGKIQAAVAKEAIGAGPFLANYYSGLKETCVQAYERTARELFGARYAIGVSSGTGALHAAFAAVGVGPGAEVICPAVGFMATAAAVVAANGVPVFCDVDESLSIDPAKIEAAITPRTVAIAPTHVQGSVCDMRAVMRVARKHKLKVVEDCAQSAGASFRGKLLGTFGDIGCFSIRANQLAECGGLWRPVRFAPPRYEGELFSGTNYRMSELEAAVDAVQLKKLPATVKRFRTVKHRILKRLKTFAEVTPQKLNDPDGEVGYAIRFYPATLELGAGIVNALRAEGVGCHYRGAGAAPDWHQYSFMFPITLKTGPTPVSCPYQCPVYEKAGGEVSYARGDCPVADDLFDRVVTVPLNQWYTASDCRHVAAGINKVLSAYCTRSAAAAPWM